MSDLRLVGVGTGLEVGLFNPPAIPGECPLVLSQLPATTAPGVRAELNFIYRSVPLCTLQFAVDMLRIRNTG